MSISETPLEPMDQAIRDRIRTEIDRNMCVEAGAGTGKTTIMVARVVEIIRTGRATIDSMVIITFTEKAAAELSTRVREALEKALRNTEDPQEQQRFDEALKGIYRARIETIHAFASSLLRERPVEAKLDPNFDVLDVLRADLSFDEQFRTWINEYLGGEREDLDTGDFRKALNRGLGIGDLRLVCDLVHGHRHMLPLKLPAVADPDVFAFRSFLLDEADTLRELSHSAIDRSDKGLLQIYRVLDFAARCERAGDDRERLERVILAASETSSTAGNKSNWDPPAYNTEQKAIRKQINEELKQIQQQLRSSALCAIMPLAQTFAQEYENRRRSAGQAEFEDLLIWARNLLRDELHVRRDFQQRFTCLMVDEFQDTDPLQVEIVMFLASDGQESKDWTTLAPTAGKLFLVGDPKQSIYRFRRADISIYEQVKTDVMGDSVELIQQNFRSVPEVISWVNDVFSTLIEREERIQPTYVDLQAFVKSTGQPALPVVAVNSLEPETKADDVRHEEARLLAGTIKLAVEEGWPVRDGSDGETRPATYGDVAILLPRRTGLNHYEDVFSEAGIPFRHEGGKEFFQRQEIRDLRACLRAIDNPGDTMSIVAALRSGAFGCSDQDLFDWRQAQRGFDYRHVPEEESGVVADGLRTLCALHDQRINLSLPEIVEQTIEQTSLVEFALTLPNGGDQSAANLLKMVDQARAFSSASGGGLRAFVRWTITSSETRSDESDAAVAESTDDVVRLLTIHAAKGLEFPIVALVNLNSDQGGQRGAQTVPLHWESRLELRIGSKDNRYETPGFEEAAAFEDRHSAAERLRVLYVAATRAEDYLILPVAAQREKAKGLLASLLGFLPEFDETSRGKDVNGVHVLDSFRLPPLERVGAVREPLTDELIAREQTDRETWAETRADLLERGNTSRRVVTASSQKGWERIETVETGAEETSADSPVERNIALQIGNALHGAMEQIDLRLHSSFDDTVRGLVDSAMDEARISRYDDHSRMRVRQMVERILESDLMQRARLSVELVQEVEFGYGLDVEGGLVQGQMDLVFYENDEIVVVDFKSDRVDVDQIQARVELSYRGQAAVYAYAAGRVTGRPIREVIFYFAEVDEQVSIPGDKLIEHGRELALQGRSQDLGYDVID
ncbi:MAG: hypothetical protein EA415_13805 [Sphaerobacteraceae bacterium]|nr:MAG: hypothetical protein EA415_13805 [Sphaerobacteraceae bacterium]